MNRWQKLAVGSALALVLLLVGGISTTIGWRPILGPKARPVTDRTFDRTAARLDRGRYLVESVSGCLDCHSERDASLPGRPPKVGTEGAGRIWDAEGTPWLVAPNITPDPETGVGRWSDDELARAIREGIGRDGRALFPIMPYERYREMSDEDVASVVVYLRSLPAIRHELPPTEVPFPLSRLINATPRPVESVPDPDLKTSEARGRYLANLGACTDCHTAMDAQGRRLMNLEFAGGFVLQDGDDFRAASNLTPAPSGIPYYDEALFVEAMRTGRVRARELHHIMPWAIYRHMTDEDLAAIWAYLRTLRPIDHSVDNAVEPTFCALCGQTHGGGERNVE